MAWGVRTLVYIGLLVAANAAPLRYTTVCLPTIFVTMLLLTHRKLPFPPSFPYEGCILDPLVSNNGCSPGWASNQNGYCQNPCTGELRWARLGEATAQWKRGEKEEKGKKEDKPEDQKSAAGEPIKGTDVNESFLGETKKKDKIHVSGTAQERELARPVEV